MGKEILEVPSGSGNGYYSGTGKMSRGSSSQNIPLIITNDPESVLMQKRIADVENGFKQLDKITDEIDYDIEIFDSKYLQSQFMELIRQFIFLLNCSKFLRTRP